MKKPEMNPKMSRLVVNLFVVLLIGGGVLFAWQTVGKLQSNDEKSEKIISINAAGRGNGRFDFKDGFDLKQSAGGMQTAAASADFNGDGVADLVSGGGQISLRFGNADSIYPNSSDAQNRRANGEFNDEPFSASAWSFYLPEAVNSLHAGDFNADGLKDVLALAFGSDSFYFLAGNGSGAFGEAQQFKVNGKITAVATGEFSRADGQTDIAIAFQTDKQSELAVYEFPEGAFKNPPEIFKLPAPATEIKIGRLDEDGLYDLAVACGKNLVFIHGHEQLYPWVQMTGANIKRPKAQIGQRIFSFGISALAIGDFDNSRRETIAILGNDSSLHLLEPPALKKEEERKRKGEGKKISDDLLMNAIAPTDGDFNSFKLVDNEKLKQIEQAEQAKNPIPMKDGKVDFDMLARANTEEWRKQLTGKTPPEPRGAPIDLKFAKFFETPASRLREWKDEIWLTDARLSNAAAQGGRQNILTPARVSGSGTDDLAIIDGFSGKIHIVSNFWARGTNQAATQKTTEISTLDVASNPLQILPLRLNSDAWSDLVVLREGATAPTVVMSVPTAVFTVTTAVDDFGDCVNNVNCSLRSAILAANTSVGTSAINFNIAGGGVQTIQVGSQLPTVTNSVIIDGTTQPGYSGSPLIEINGNLLFTPTDGLKIRASSSTVRGLVINEFRGSDPMQQVVIGGNGLTLESTTQFPNNNNNIVESNYLGTNAAGTLAKGNHSTGLNIFDSDQNRIGGAVGGAGNVISGNGIKIQTNPSGPFTLKGAGIQFINGNDNQFLGNYVGTSASGSERVGNLNGIFGGGSNNIFGGESLNEGNVISGNGFVIQRGEPNFYCRGYGLAVTQVIDENGNNLTLNNIIKGNRIGANVTGMSPLGNCGEGIINNSNSNTVIGSITSGGRNVISGNGDSAINAFQSLAGVVGGFTAIIGNNIGTNIAGNARIPVVLPAVFDGCSGFCFLYGDIYLTPSNGSFVNFGSPGGTTPGGNCTGFCNLVSGLHDEDAFGTGLVEAVFIQGSGFALVSNNYFGTNAAGNASIPNGQNGGRGIAALSQATVFVGAVFGAPGNQTSGGNLILEGLDLYQAAQSPYAQPANYIVLGNLVGTDVSGTFSLPKTGNTANQIAGHPNGAAIIGGPFPLERNVFSGAVGNFTGYGLTLFGYSIVRNNVFGRDRNETIPIPNQKDGLYIIGGPNVIGGTAPDRVEQNVIANNNGAGIYFDDFAFNENNRISANRIFNNVGLGIDIAPLGVNANDFFDLDEGANRKQNYPLLQEPIFNQDGTVTINGSILSTPDTRFLIGIFATQEADPTQYGEGGFYQGSVAATSNANGLATFTFTTPTMIDPGTVFSAVAQDPDRNSSEFSCVAGRCFADLEVTISDTPDPVEAGTELTYNVQVLNKGPAAAPNVVINLTLPTLSYNFVSATIPNGTCQQNGNQIQCEQNSMDPNQIETAVIKIEPTQFGTATVQAQVSSEAPDPNPNDNQDTEETEVTPPPIIVNRTGDEADANPNDAVCDVDTPTPENQCTLRAAMQVANTANGRDYIKFDIEGAGVQTISPANSLPEITDAVVIDGTTQAGYNSTPLIQLSGAGAGALVNGLFITGGTTLVKGLAINNFGGYGIFIQGAAGNRVEACFIGTDASGNLQSGNFLSGIRIKDSNNNVVGGNMPAKRNIISANGTLNDPVSLHGIEMTGSSTGNKVQGNYIGTNIDGTTDLGNKGAGVAIAASGNTVGGTTLAPGTGAGNVISGNDQAGIFVASNVNTTTVSNTQIQGNIIGANADGTTELPNNQYGVFLAGQVQNNYIGGGTPGSRNVISGNTGFGVKIAAPPNAGFNAANNYVQGNYIGTDVTGMNRLPNTLTGVSIDDANTNTIGGNNAAQRNLISGNGENGIAIGQTDPNFNTAFQNQVKGNYIGTNSDGSSAIYNTSAGVLIGNGAANNTVGGSLPTDRNTISGNHPPDGTGAGIGVAITLQAHGNSILGNHIGTNAEGEGAIPNRYGIVISTGAHDNNVGLFSIPTGRNVISGNVISGVVVGNPLQNPLAEFASLATEKKKIIRSEDDFNSLRLIVSSKFQTVDFSKIPSFEKFSKPSAETKFLGAVLTRNNNVENNFIGTNADGTGFVGNEGSGIWVTNEAQNTRIGGFDVAAKNVISGNSVAGILVATLDDDSPTRPINTRIFNNHIGTNKVGTGSIGNGTGISVDGAANTFIGGANGGRNIISGNSDFGIDVRGTDSNGVFIKNNYIGTNANGTGSIGNAGGVRIENSVGNLVGVDTIDEEKNIISGNTSGGIALFSIPSNGITNSIRGNYIGTDATGNAVLNGQQFGIILDQAVNTYIGGEYSKSYNVENVIGGNSVAGISMSGSAGNYIRANRIGVGANGQTPLANGFGILITNDSANNDFRQNFVQSSTADGMILDGEGTFGNFFRNNFIGGLDELPNLGNGLSGVRLRNGAHDNNFGDRFTGGNTIQYNGRLGAGDGITLEATAGINNIIDPTIFKGNSRMGIDLNGDGILTPNDAGDEDEGPNRLQNYPEITATAINGNGELIVTYRVTSDTAYSDYGAEGLYVEFFKSTLRNEGQTFLNSDFYTDQDYANGLKTINLGDAATLGIGTSDRVTATATDASGNTSEFFPAYPLSPTSANVSVSGMVSGENGQALRFATVSIFNADRAISRTAKTNSFGRFRFEALPVGEIYVITVSYRQYVFGNNPRILNLTDEVTDVDFEALK